MESLWKLVYLLEPAPVTLITTAVAVTFASAFRALNYGKEMERNRDLSEASITLDRSQALMIPVMSSFSLLLMFYLFSSVSQLLTAFTAIASASSLYFCLSPYVAYLKSQFGLADPFVSRCCSKSFTRIQGLLLISCSIIVAAWLVSGHWILNNLLGISICIAFVSHAIPGMLLALVLCFDYRKSRDTVNLFELHSSKGHKYIWYALPGYAIGLVTALAAGVLTHSPQPALLYLVPSTLGPVVAISWIKKELFELWEGNMPNYNIDKDREIEV
ncbi:signal peptide peptidase-like [Stylosanthes scabra]|uniref:Signal peptide peptidase-like n=1 Tax=Stylosanthes scabra TaxID=79078 RepID=A0ABU6RAX2_9FABA|nr:signal peptide peptidase-like [Stylosanthes scabra]